ncbi:MAG: ribosomal protein S18-alanine N-acetyltransferase [Chloroflexi bacterium]|nr:ribosomal protein S18-alanine N-acetyltransferase [Anaerolineaceae bacterium]NMB88686.1 ribosomal protein S18-alanine N-acetyltransferase [Chloroflexota bacterium]
MDVDIRPMQMEDLEQVGQIDRLSFSMPWPQRSFRFELTQNPASHLWVAALRQDTPRRVVGVIVTWVIVDEAHIGTIAVHPEYRQAGIGKRLLACALLDAWQAGARQAFLEVRRSNLAAQALYTRVGFVVEAVRPRYYRDNGEDALLMTLKEFPLERLRMDAG